MSVFRAIGRFYRFNKFTVHNPKHAPKTIFPNGGDGGAIFRWIWFFCRPYKIELSAYFLVHLFRYIVFASATVFFAKIVELFEKGKVSPDLQEPLYILGLFLLLNLLCYSLWVLILRRRAICDKISREMSLYAVRHYMGLSLHWHELSESGAKMQRITAARDGLYKLLDLAFWEGTEFFAVFISTAIAISVMDMPSYFIWLVFAYMGSYLWLSAYSGRWLNRPNDRYFRAIENVNARAYEFLSSIATLKVFNLQSHLVETGCTQEKKAHHAKMDLTIREARRWAITDILATAWIIGIALLALFEVRDGEMSAAAFGMVSLLTISIWNRIEGFTKIYSSGVEYYTSIRRLVHNLSVRPVIIDREDAIILPSGRHDLGRYDIDFRDVAFTYKNHMPVLNDLNLHISHQEKIGLIGPSGAGKTTLVKLLVRFYDISQGSLTIGAKQISHLSLHSLREAIGIIPQDIALFNHSLMENIRYGRLDASDEEVLEAAKRAHAHEFISALPDGYGTMVGERGVKLSGGQRQRIAIARAILKDAPILILDEATSALDSESEKLIQESLQDLMKGKTVIAIAHRLSTIAHLDRLIVMDKGQIVEDGTHQNLLKQDGLYKKLWTMQSGGFLGE